MVARGSKVVARLVKSNRVMRLLLGRVVSEAGGLTRSPSISRVRVPAFDELECLEEIELWDLHGPVLGALVQGERNVGLDQEVEQVRRVFPDSNKR